MATRRMNVLVYAGTKPVMAMTTYSFTNTDNYQAMAALWKLSSIVSTAFAACYQTNTQSSQLTETLSTISRGPLHARSSYFLVARIGATATRLTAKATAGLDSMWTEAVHILGFVRVRNMEASIANSKRERNHLKLWATENLLSTPEPVAALLFLGLSTVAKQVQEQSS